MRKGLVVTLGVALVLSVVPAFSEAPIISCIPDIIISDLDLGGQTVDSNVWVFEDALDLDEFVQDADTGDDALRWSFIETGAATIEINGLGSVDPANVQDPGALNIRTGNGLITLENVAMQATDTDQEADITFFVSDGDKVASQTVTVTTVNVDDTATSLSQGDALVPQGLKTFEFTSNEEGWTFSSFGTVAGVITEPSHAWAGGALTMTQAQQPSPILVYGSYESPKDPAQAVLPKVGCVLRARYQLRSTAASDVATPGFRLHAVTKHVVFAGGQWSPNFSSLDFIDEAYVQYGTQNFVQQVRVPGAAGREFTLLYFPNQVPETLLSTSTITYFTFELLDTEAGTDAGTLSVDRVVIDAIDRPDDDVGTVVPSLSTTNFTSAEWTAGAITQIQLTGVTPNITGLTHGAQNGDLVISVQPGNQWFEAFIFKATGEKLQPGNYYRVQWELTGTASGSFVEPRVRLAVVSEFFIWLAVKEQQGGAFVAGLTSEPQNWEQWFVAPSVNPRDTASGLTENMTLRFGSWQGAAAEFPVTQNVGGQARALSVTTHVFDPIP